MIASPDARTVGLQQGDGSLVVSGTDAVLVLNEMDAAPAGKTYEVWVLDGCAYVSRPGPRIADTVELMAQCLHPQTFGAPEGPHVHHAV